MTVRQTIVPSALVPDMQTAANTPRQKIEKIQNGNSGKNVTPTT